MKTEDQVWQEAAEVLGKALGMRYDFATGPFGRILFEEMVERVAKNIGKSYTARDLVDETRAQIRNYLYEVGKLTGRCNTVEALDHLLQRLNLRRNLRRGA